MVRVAAVRDARACPCTWDGTDIPRDRQLYIVAVGARWPLKPFSGDRVELAYALDVIPLIVSRGTADEHLRFQRCEDGGYCAVADSPYPWGTTAVGGGILPLGLVGRIRVVSGLHVQLRGSAGAVRLSRPVPLLEGRKFNFLLEGATATELEVGRDMSVTVGLAINHISNGGTAAINPGMNSRLLEFGVLYHR